MKTKVLISFAVTAKLISTFVFTTWIVQFLFFLNLKFPASSNLLCLYSSVCVGPVRKQKLLVFSCNLPAYINTVFCACMPHQLSRLVGKPTICICENKDADQLRGNREADQRLCFRYSDSIIPLLLKSEISSF